MKNIALAILLLSGTAFAGTSAVTATITDTDSQTWNNGSWTATLSSPGGAPTVSGTPVTATFFSGKMNGSGVLSVTLTDTSTIDQSGAKWVFVICPNASAPCGTISTTVVGATPSLSTVLSAGIIAPRFAPGQFSYGYLDKEVTGIPVQGAQYYQVTCACIRSFSTTNGWTGNGGSSSAAWSSLTNPTGNLSLTMGAHNSAFANTNNFSTPGTFTSPWLFPGNGIDIPAEWNILYAAFMPNGYPSDQMDVGLTVPATSNLLQSNAFAAFATCAEPSGNHYCVASYAQARRAAANSFTHAFNANVNDDNFGGGFALFAGEFNSQVHNVSSGGASLLVSANIDNANTPYDGFYFQATGAQPYRYGMNFKDGSASTAVNIGKDTNGQNSMPMGFNNVNGFADFYYSTANQFLFSAPVASPAFVATTVYSVAGTALPTCGPSSYAGSELPVSDLATTTAGAVYAGSGTVSGIVACGSNTGGLYSWYVVGAATFTGVTQMTDTFVGTVNTDLAAHTADTGESWVQFNASNWGALLLLTGSQQVTPSFSAPSAYYANYTPASADYTVTLSCTLAVAGGDWCMPLGRVAGASSSTFTGYGCLFQQGTGVQLMNWTSGSTLTQFGTTYAGVSSGTHTVSLVMSGTSISCKLDGSSVAGPSATDSTYSAAGHPAAAVNGTGYFMNTPFTVR